MIIRICAWCGKPFEAKRETAAYCQTSASCKLKFNRARKKRIIAVA